jgi:hypothetical protein
MLTVGQTATQDVKMELGAVAPEVTVKAGADMLNTTTASVGMTGALTKSVWPPATLRNMEGVQ